MRFLLPVTRELEHRGGEREQTKNLPAASSSSTTANLPCAAIDELVKIEYYKVMLNTKSLSYTVLFERAEEGGYVAFVPALPGCMTQGETFEEAKENIQDAIVGYIQVLREDGDDVPTEYREHIAATIAVPEYA